MLWQTTVSHFLTRSIQLDFDSKKKIKIDSYDARLSRCNKKQSSMTSHVHFHDPDGMPPRIAMDSISSQAGNEVLNEETNILTYNHQKKASPKKPYCTEDDTLMWTSAIDNFKIDSDDEAYAYFTPGSVGCCGRRFYRLVIKTQQKK